MYYFHEKYVYVKIELFRILDFFQLRINWVRVPFKKRFIHTCPVRVHYVSVQCPCILIPTFPICVNQSTHFCTHAFQKTCLRTFKNLFLTKKNIKRLDYIDRYETKTCHQSITKKLTFTYNVKMTDTG